MFISLGHRRPTFYSVKNTEIVYAVRNFHTRATTDWLVVCGDHSNTKSRL
jgi:hypothetical protein